MSEFVCFIGTIFLLIPTVIHFIASAFDKLESFHLMDLICLV